MIVEAQNPKSSTHRAAVFAVCPSCGVEGYFSYHGDQHWPVRIAESVGVPACVSLWNCQHCHTTITELSLPHPHCA